MEEPWFVALDDVHIPSAVNFELPTLKKKSGWQDSWKSHNCLSQTRWAGTGWLQHTTEWKYLAYSKYSINSSCPLILTRHRFFLPCHVTTVWGTLSLWTCQEMNVIVVTIYANKMNSFMWRCLHLRVYLRCFFYNTGCAKCTEIHLAESLRLPKEIG